MLKFDEQLRIEDLMGFVNVNIDLCLSCQEENCDRCIYKKETETRELALS